MLFETIDAFEVYLPDFFKRDESVRRWDRVDLIVHRPWYYVIYDIEIEGGIDENNISFFSLPERIVEMLSIKIIRIKDLYLVSPGYLNGSDGWQLDRIREEWKAELKNDIDGTSRIYVLEDGREYVNSLCSKDRDDFTKHEIVFKFEKTN